MLVFCSRYRLHAGGVHNPFISKVGVNGSNICDALRKTCPTRHVFMDFAAQHRDLLDVQFSGMRPMLLHATFKYLVNLEVGVRVRRAVGDATCRGFNAVREGLLCSSSSPGWPGGRPQANQAERLPREAPRRGTE